MTSNTNANPSDSLATELEFFEEKRAEFCRDHLNKFALVKGREQHGFFSTEEDAFTAGVELFGLESFLIKQVLHVETIYDIPAYYLGMINAIV